MSCDNTCLIASLSAVVVALLLLVGCGDDPCPEGCAEGESCVSNRCVSTAAQCDPECGDGERCINGFCFDEPQACDTVGVTCDPTRPSADGFLCIDLDGPGPGEGQCLSNCGAGGACDPGAICFFVASAVDTPCAADAECGDGLVCQQGACRQTICRPSECEGYLDGIETCQDIYDGTGAFGYEALCAEVGNDAAYCFSSGPRDVGEACVDLADAIDSGDFSAACQPGLGCVDGACQTACRSVEDCDGEESCLLAQENFFGDGVGFCASPCSAFSDDAPCPQGQTCLPAAVGEGLCVQSGTVEPFESCAPGGRQCVAGTTCVQLQGQNAATGADTLARCMPICDVNAGLANPDGSVGAVAQAQRDATCPNPPAAASGVEFVNLAASVGPVDIYIADDMTPTFADVQFGERTDADDMAEGSQFFEVDAGALQFRVLSAGAPRTDPELIGGTIALSAGEGESRAIIAESGTTESAFSLPVRPLNAQPGQDASLYLTHAASDVDQIDVVAVPAGDDLSDPSLQVELGAALTTGQAGDAVVTTGSWDILAFAAGDPLDDRTSALAELAGLTLEAGSQLELYLAGTADATDLAPLEIVALQAQAPFLRAPDGPTYTCVDLTNGVFGYCQQECSGASDYGAGGCQGANMGCVPQFVTGPEVFESLCSPVGTGQSADACNPLARFGECAEGLYCLEYGNTVAGFDAADRGRCTELCVEDDPQNESLSCSSEMSCAALSADEDFTIGQCGFACEPDMSYADAMCPAGLGSCLPRATLVEDPANTEAPPAVREQEPFCAAAGNLGVGDACNGSDCGPAAECLFERSVQGTFINSLLSSYVGAAGQQSSCTPRCDPFDEDSSAFVCSQGETCLFNFPFSAEVGHCATIAENVSPGGTCSQPGLACGEDSICVVNGAENVCFQFCQYLGDDGSGGFARSGCASGLECRPLVADIGVCQDAG